jgi:hypothetical protein
MKTLNDYYAKPLTNGGRHAVDEFSYHSGMEALRQHERAERMKLLVLATLVGLLLMLLACG